MAFGFARRTTGLIAAPEDPAALPDRVRQFLVDFARSYADEAIVIADTTKQGIAAAIRKHRPDFLFTLDAGHRALAEDAHIHFVPCFPDPVLFHGGTAATLQGEAPVSLRSAVRVCLFGPESTGKTTLAVALAGRYRTLHVTEYVRGYLDATGSSGIAADVPWIARGQRAAEIATAAQAGAVLVCDTNLATIMLWSEVLFGSVPDWLRDEALRQTFDLWLLTDIDVPFEPDPQRCFPASGDREWLMRQCTGLLERLRVTPVWLRGSHEERTSIACSAIDRLLARRS